MLGITSVPNTDLGTLARIGFPPEEADERFSLKIGDVSKVETDGAPYVIYKIASKGTISEDTVTDEMSRQIAHNKFNEAMRSVNESTKPDFNQAYFGSPVDNVSAGHASPFASPHP